MREMRILNHCSSVCRGVIGGQQSRGMFRPPCSDRRSQRMGSHLRIIKPLLLPRAHHLTPVSCHLCMITQPPSPPSLCPIKQMGSSTWLFLSSLYPLFPPPPSPSPPSLSLHHPNALWQCWLLRLLLHVSLK